MVTLDLNGHSECDQFSGNRRQGDDRNLTWDISKNESCTLPFRDLGAARDRWAGRLNRLQ